MGIHLKDLFDLSLVELDKIFGEYKIESKPTLWLLPDQRAEVSCVKHSDVILMFFQGSLIMYCERVSSDMNKNPRELEKRFKDEVKYLPSNVHSKILDYAEFTEIQLYRKEYLELLEDGVSE